MFRNHVVPKHEATVVCTYDLSRFSASSVIDVLRTHPVAIIGGVVHENPFYVTLDELLREIQERKRRRGAAPVA